MILEYAQLLSTAHRMLDGHEETIQSSSGRKKKVWVHPNDQWDQALYGVTHRNHPSAVWVRESGFNYLWVYQCMIALNEEYKHRYNHAEDHLTIQKLGVILSNTPKYFDGIENLTSEPPQCVADDCKQQDTIRAYWAYYNGHKAGIARWKSGNIPPWFMPHLDETTRQTMYGKAPDPEPDLDEADQWLKDNDPEFA